MVLTNTVSSNTSRLKLYPLNTSCPLSLPFSPCPPLPSSKNTYRHNECKRGCINGVDEHCLQQHIQAGACLAVGVGDGGQQVGHQRLNLGVADDAADLQGSRGSRAGGHGGCRPRGEAGVQGVAADLQPRDQGLNAGCRRLKRGWMRRVYMGG